ncbi:MAG: ABC transporter ATP-binding protein [Omnitrophica WOR_2 bacterium]
MAFVTPSNLEQLQAVEIPDAAISARNLTKRFGAEAAVDHATFDVPRGSVFGFIGPSGSGKTTTIRLLTGIYKPTEGQVVVLGKDPTKFSHKNRAKLGYMPQLFVLYPNLTVWENLNFAASIYGMSLFRGKRLNQVLDFVELREHRHKLVRNISGGMQRRLSLATTLVHNPELIFLDEPTAGVDPVLRRKFWDHFKELQHQNRTLFVTTQYVNEASYCDLVGVMANGHLLMVDTPQGLRKRAFKGDVINIRTVEPIDYMVEQQLNNLAMVRGSVIRQGPSKMRMVVDEARTAIPDLMEWMRSKNIGVDSVEEYLPPFDDVFVELVKDQEPTDA